MMEQQDQKSLPPQPERMVWTAELVDRFWNGFSQTRLTELSFGKMNGRSVVIAMDHYLGDGKTVLDFGAGDGHLVKYLCERGARVAAFEPSQGRAAHLADALKDISGFLGVVGPDTTQQYDIVVMSEVIEHVLDDQIDATLALIWRLLKPNGILIITTPNNEDLDLGMAYCPVSNMMFHRWQHVRSFTHHSLPAFLKGFGFKEIATHRVDFNEKNFVPYDAKWGGCTLTYDALPFHIRLIREGRSCYMGTECNLLYFGQREE